MLRFINFLTILIFYFSANALGQIGISNLNSPPDQSAMLDIRSTTKGLLIPRMNTNQKNNIPNKVEGLTVYDTDLRLFSFWQVGNPTGNWVNFPSNSQNQVPSGTVVLSETQLNTSLSNAGFSLAGKINTSFSAYAFNNFSWSAPISTINEPLSTDSHTAVWTGTEMIIWGGYDLNGELNSGKIYNPTTNQWRNMATPTLTARGNPTAFWTGTKMIFWGGGLWDGGGMYDPQADSWAYMTTNNAPTIRDNFSTVWTGSSLLVWGGSVFSNTAPLLSDGKIYNLTNNSWANMSTNNAPSGRERQSTVWTGSKMIVFGGVTGTKQIPLVTNTGTMYDPNTNIWQPLSTIGAPYAKNHKAIWTGTKMIVWGGDGGNNNAPYIYDPILDNWTTGSTTNAPEMRKYHTLIWTGTKMIAFGGTSQINSNTGGIYDPTTDQWENNNIILNSPNQYVGHSAVWTGNEMIIFGPSPGQKLSSGFSFIGPSSKDYYLFKKD